MSAAVRGLHKLNKEQVAGSAETKRFAGSLCTHQHTQWLHHLPLQNMQALLQLAWRSWRQAMRLRQELLYAVDMASSSRRQRILSSVFNVWLQYVSVSVQSI